MSRPLISIVIPAYNVTKYISRCLTSILTQTFRDFEVVVVDDGSDDGVGDLVSSFRDNRVRIVRHGKNRSVLQARITATISSAGDYIVPVDPDDELFPDALARMAEAIRSDGRVDCFLYGVSVCLNGNEQAHSLQLKSECYQSESFLKEVNDRGIIFWSQWGKIFRRSLYLKCLADLSIDESEYLNIGEDILLTVPLLCGSTLISKLDFIGYHYIIHDNSLTSASENPEKIRKSIRDNGRAFKLLDDYLKRVGSKRSLCEVVGSGLSLLIDTYFTRIEKYADCAWGDFAFLMFELFDPALVWQYIFKWRQHRWSAFPYERVSKRSKRCAVKRIGVVCGGVEGGGTERATMVFVGQLAKNGFGVVLYVDEDRTTEDAVCRCVPAGAELVRLPARYKIVNRWRALSADIARRCLDVVVHSDYWREDTLTDILSSRQATTNVIVAEHTSFFCSFYSGTPYYVDLHARAYRMADTVTVLSLVNERWWKSVGVTNAVYMPNFLTFGDRTYAPSEEEVSARFAEQRFLFVARLTDLKGVHKAILAFVRFAERHPSATLTFLGTFGDEAYESYCRKIVEDAKLTERVVFMGFVTDVSKYYRQATALLMCSKVEGAPMTLMEAKSYSVPAVIYAMGYVDGTAPGDGVVSVPYDDIGAMSEALEKICTNVDTYRELTIAARRSLGAFSNAAVLGRWKKLFETLKTRNGDPLPISYDDALALALLEARKISRMCQPFAPSYVVKTRNTTVSATIEYPISYLIGCGVTWPFRMVRNTFVCLGENGLSYTIRRVPIKFVNLYKRFCG